MSDSPKFAPKITQRTETWSQEEDSAGRTGEDYQDLEISLIDAGGGHYIVLKTERWALNEDEIDAFAEELKKRFEGLHSL